MPLSHTAAALAFLPPWCPFKKYFVLCEPSHKIQKCFMIRQEKRRGRKSAARDSAATGAETRGRLTSLRAPCQAPPLHFAQCLPFLFIFFNLCLITEFFSTRNNALSVSIIESVIKSPLQVP